MLSSYHKRRGNLQEDTNPSKTIIPDDKQDQAVKKVHMQTLTKNSNNKYNNNDNLAQSRAMRQIKPPVKLDL